VKVRLFVEVGQQFGRLTVVDPEVRVSGVRAAVCRCECGNTATTTIKRLRGGRTRSCGCLRSEQTACRNKASATHGLSGHPLFGTWALMLDRCENPAAQNYASYGGRGIHVCPRWHDPAAFIEDIERILGPRPEGMSLDRIRNGLGYKPSNVRWATPTEQARNRRSRHVPGHPSAAHAEIGPALNAATSLSRSTAPKPSLAGLQRLRGRPKDSCADAPCASPPPAPTQRRTGRMRQVQERCHLLY
jgi:hypothetical protein